MELRRNGTINIPFFLSSKNRLEKKHQRGRGFLDFIQAKWEGKTPRLNTFQILDKSKEEEHHYTREIARKQMWELWREGEEWSAICKEKKAKILLKFCEVKLRFHPNKEF